MAAVRVDHSRFGNATWTTLLMLLAVSGCAGGPQCAPYARSLTGLALSGDAAAWWRQSDGRYPHADRPAPGAVLVFRPTPAMRDGHVAVVRRLVVCLVRLAVLMPDGWNNQVLIRWGLGVYLLVVVLHKPQCTHKE